MTSSDTPLAPRPHAGILAIEPYVPGKSKAPGIAGPVHKLSSNESPLGPSPHAVAAFLDAAGRLQAYPDGPAVALRAAIGRRHELDPDRIVCGTGSGELLFKLANIYVEPRDEGIITQHGFLLYPTAILAAGGVPVVARERDLTADVDAILAAVTAKTRIVFVANPNNPTGTYLTRTEMTRLADRLPPNVLLVVDEAYAEFATMADFGDSLGLAHDRQNVVVTRTFSKAYGLASLRIGWCYAPAAVCDAMNRVRCPFNVNEAALHAGIAAIDDEAHLDAAVTHNTHWREILSREIAGLDFAVTPSGANFILVHTSDEPEARALDTFLTDRGLILRLVKAYGLPQGVRLSVGSEMANQLVIAAFADFAKRRRT